MNISFWSRLVCRGKGRVGIGKRLETLMRVLVIGVPECEMFFLAVKFLTACEYAAAVANSKRRATRLSDKKEAGAWIGGLSFDAFSGNATTVAKITCLLISLRFSAQVRPSNFRQDEVGLLSFHCLQNVVPLKFEAL